MLYALNDPLASFVFIYCMEMYVKMCTSCTNKDIYINILKQGLDSEIKKNYRQTCHLFQIFLKKLLLPKYIVI